MSLSAELREAKRRVARLEKAAERKRSNRACSKTQHEWRARQSMTAISGHDRFLAGVKAVSGVDLPHAGYHIYECISCGKWSIQDYCGGEHFEISAEAAAALI